MRRHQTDSRPTTAAFCNQSGVESWLLIWVRHRMIATRAIIDNVKEVGNRHPTGKTISLKKFTDGMTFIFYRTLFPLKWVSGITQSPSNYRCTPGPQVPLIIGRRWESQVSDRSELNSPDFMYSGFWSCSKEPSKAQQACSILKLSRSRVVNSLFVPLCNHNSGSQKGLEPGMHLG
jgi:hypothetical protein